MKHFVVILLVLSAGIILLGAPQPARAARPLLPVGFSRVALGSGLDSPTAMAFVGNRIFVTQKGGAIRIVRANGVLRGKPWGTLKVSTESERGLLGIALDPDYPTNGFIYVYYTTGLGAKNYSGTPENRVSRLKLKVDKSGFRERILLDHIPSTNGNHNGGDIHFGFDGKLYISVGESGCCPDDAQALNTLRGKILRINRDGTIPTDNPFYNTPNARKEIYAYGFRNPWRIGKRDANQTYLVADVGSGTWEEIDSLQAGANYGWPQFEGPCPNSNLNCNPATVNYGSTQKPIHWYHHSVGTEQGDVIAGGVFASNPNYPALYANAYFYADSAAGWVHTLTLNNANQVTAQNNFDDGVGYPVSFGVGPDGSVYVVDFGGGVIYKYIYNAP